MIKIYTRQGLSCDEHRLILPMQHMKGLALTQSDYMATTIVFSRIFPSGIHELRKLKQMGKRIIMDLDDYWHLYPEHYLFRGWNPQIYIDHLKLADLVTTTNKALAKEISEFNTNVHVVPNALPYDTGQFIPHVASGQGNFKFIGGNSHALDITLIPDCTIPKQIPVNRYMEHYKNVNLCYAPLIDNKFNRLKSNLKALEAGVNYSALMASDIPPYRNVKDKGKVILVKNSHWEKRIAYCRGNPEYVKDMGRALGKHVREHYNLFKVNELRRQIWEG